MRRICFALVALTLVLGACAPSDGDLAEACKKDTGDGTLGSVTACIQRRQHDRDKPAWSETAKLFGR